jgi:hypothetical protein
VEPDPAGVGGALEAGYAPPLRFGGTAIDSRAQQTVTHGVVMTPAEEQWDTGPYVGTDVRLRLAHRVALLGGPATGVR